MYLDISNIEQAIPSFSAANIDEPTIYTSTSGDDNSTSDDSYDKYNEHIMIKVNSDIPLRQEIIQEEPSLTTYTDNHFFTLTKRDLENLQQEDPFFQEEFSNYRSNSPVLSVLDTNNNSNNNSDDENMDSSINRNSTHHSNKNKYNKLDTSDIENYVKKYYSNCKVDTGTTELDILTTFVRGQKNLYSQSKLITLHKLYLLVFPALVIAASITVISAFIDCNSDDNSEGLISGQEKIASLRSRDRSAFISASEKDRPIAIASPTLFIVVVSLVSASGNFSKANLGTFTTM